MAFLLILFLLFTLFAWLISSHVFSKFVRIFDTNAFATYIARMFEQSFYLSRASSDEYDGSIVWIDFNRVGPFVYFKHS